MINKKIKTAVNFMAICGIVLSVTMVQSAALKSNKAMKETGNRINETKRFKTNQYNKATKDIARKTQAPVGDALRLNIVYLAMMQAVLAEKMTAILRTPKKFGMQVGGKSFNNAVKLVTDSRLSCNMSSCASNAIDYLRAGVKSFGLKERDIIECGPGGKALFN
jgi:hypothetical protein